LPRQDIRAPKSPTRLTIQHGLDNVLLYTKHPTQTKNAGKCPPSLSGSGVEGISIGMCTGHIKKKKPTRMYLSFKFVLLTPSSWHDGPTRQQKDRTRASLKRPSRAEHASLKQIREKPTCLDHMKALTASLSQSCPMPLPCG